MSSYLSERIADCEELRGRHPEAVGGYVSSLRYWRAVLRRNPSRADLVIDPDHEIRATARDVLLCHKIAVSYERHCDYDLSLKWLHRGLKALPEKRRPRPLMARIYVSMGVALYRKGLCEEAIGWGRKGLALARQAGDAAQAAYAHDMLGSSYLDTGQLRLALSHRRSAVAFWNETGDLASQSVANNNLGVAYQAAGELDLARAQYVLCRQASQRLGNLGRYGVACNNIGEIFLQQGNLAEAAGNFEDVITTYQQKGGLSFAAGFAMVNLSKVLERQGRLDEALRRVEAGLDMLRRAGARELAAEALLQEGQIRLGRGQVDLAHGICMQVLRESRDMGYRVLEARSLRVLGQVLISEGDSLQAETNLQQSIELAGQVKADYERAVSLAALVRLWRSQGKGNDGRYGRAIRQATAILEAMGATADLADLNRLN